MKAIKLEKFEHYLVTTDGKVYNTKAAVGLLRKGPKLLKSWPNKNTNYHTVVLRNGIDKPKCVYVHRLVAEVYLPNPLKLPEVNHKDMDKSNNSVSNLEWVNRKQNKQHQLLNTKRKNSKILEDSDLIKKGIEIYKKYGELKYPAELWNCKNCEASKILRLHNISLYYRTTVPIYVKKELIEYNNSKKISTKELVQYAYRTYNIKLTKDITYKIKNNHPSLFSTL